MGFYNRSFYSYTSKKEEATCQCGKTFIKNTPNQKNCPECLTKKYYTYAPEKKEPKKIELIACKHCGKEFEKAGARRYCSPDCQIESHNTFSKDWNKKKYRMNKNERKNQTNER